MMWYAWVNYRGTFADYYDLLYGSLEDIADELISNGDGIIEIEQITKEDYEGTWNEQSFKNFFKFKAKKTHTEKMIKSYIFEYCDYVTSVEFLVKGFPEFVKKFNAYAEEDDLFYRIRPDIEETEENISQVLRYFDSEDEDAFDKFFIEVED